MTAKPPYDSWSAKRKLEFNQTNDPFTGPYPYRKEGCQSLRLHYSKRHKYLQQALSEVPECKDSNFIPSFVTLKNNAKPRVSLREVMETFEKMDKKNSFVRRKDPIIDMHTSDNEFTVYEDANESPKKPSLIQRGKTWFKTLKRKDAEKIKSMMDSEKVRTPLAPLDVIIEKSKKVLMQPFMTMRRVFSNENKENDPFVELDDSN